MKTEELRELIDRLLDMIDDEAVLLLIYRYINRIFCRK